MHSRQFELILVLYISICIMCEWVVITLMSFKSKKIFM